MPSSNRKFGGWGMAAAVQAAVMAFWLSHGYTTWQAQALTESARIESGFQPCIIAKSGSRWLYQWVGIRARRLQEFAHTTGCPPLEAQLRFADMELRTVPVYGCFFGATNYASALAAVRRGFERGRC